MTLTEFLLARIAEDEQMATEGVDGGRCTCRPNPQSLLGRIDMHHPQCALRVLAECEVKRRIVEELIDMEPVEDERREQVVTFRWVVQALTAVYSDHPDYREEWRVA